MQSDLVPGQPEGANLALLMAVVQGIELSSTCWNSILTCWVSGLWWVSPVFTSTVVSFLVLWRPVVNMDKLQPYFFAGIEN